MTTQEPANLDILSYSARQYASYVGLAFVVWLAFIPVVRALPASAYDTSEPWPILLFVASIGLGIVTQLASPFLVRLPAERTLIPIVVICGCALMLDGIAISFTDIYSSDVEIKVFVGGWLLWTFGSQIIISMLIISRIRRH